MGPRMGTPNGTGTRTGTGTGTCMGNRTGTRTAPAWELARQRAWAFAWELVRARAGPSPQADLLAQAQRTIRELEANHQKDTASWLIEKQLWQVERYASVNMYFVETPIEAIEAILCVSQYSLNTTLFHL